VGAEFYLIRALTFFFSLSSYGEDMHERFLIIILRSRGGGNFIIVEEAEALTGEDEEEAGYSLPGCTNKEDNAS